MTSNVPRLPMVSAPHFSLSCDKSIGQVVPRQQTSTIQDLTTQKSCSSGMHNHTTENIPAGALLTPPVKTSARVYPQAPFFYSTKPHSIGCPFLPIPHHEGR